MPISCSSVHLVVPEADAERRLALASLEAMLARLPETGFAEVWVMHGRFPALCALLNGERGWLTCLRAEGDAGFSSRNGGVLSIPAAADADRAGRLHAPRAPVPSAGATTSCQAKPNS